MELGQGVFATEAAGSAGTNLLGLVATPNDLWLLTPLRDMWCPLEHTPTGPKSTEVMCPVGSLPASTWPSGETQLLLGKAVAHTSNGNSAPDQQSVLG